MSGEDAWLVRFYQQDETARGFWRVVLDDLPRTVRSIEPDDDPQLLSFLVTPAIH